VKRLLVHTERVKFSRVKAHKAFQTPTHPASRSGPATSHLIVAVRARLHSR
jgi:hypothetical protein